MHRPQRKSLSHQVPEWVYTKELNPCFFITINCKERGKNSLANNTTWDLIEESIRLRQVKGDWFCSLFLAMPDHIHGLFRFPHVDLMGNIVRDWKKWVARQGNIQWQSNFFDHRIRNTDQGIYKRQYIIDNPVRAGLVSDGNDWRYKIDFLEELKR